MANDPSGPFGLGVGPQQFTGSPAIGNGLFSVECKARSFFVRRLFVEEISWSSSIGKPVAYLPAGGNEDDDGYNNSSANSGTSCNGDFVHI